MDFLALARNPDFVALRDEYVAKELAHLGEQLEQETLKDQAEIAAIRARMKALRWLFVFVDSKAEEQAHDLGQDAPPKRALTLEPFPRRFRR